VDGQLSDVLTVPLLSKDMPPAVAQRIERHLPQTWALLRDFEARNRKTQLAAHSAPLSVVSSN